MKIISPALVLWLLAAGCAPIEPPEPSGDHPSSPAAPAARDAKLSDVLAVDEANLPQKPPEMRRSGMGSGGQMEGLSPENKSGRTFSCPMHPDVVSEEPGKCPRCGMDLVKKERRRDE